jgi:omega-6 fatty acid desaturase (delta-12 desaturase)
MPHYHAQEATEALKGVMGEWYMYSDEGVVKSVWKMWTECRFVEDEGERAERSEARAVRI